MDELLYLDTARIGRMTPEAFEAYTGYLSLAGHEGGSAYFERFLRAGLSGCPEWMSVRYPALKGWSGIGSLAQSLRVLAGSQPGLPVLLSSRSAQLMKFAARLLYRPCQNVLTTDLCWPAYRAILEAECQRSDAKVSVVPLREFVLELGATEDNVVEAVCSEYSRLKCDGLFLPAVSNLGVRLPVARIVRRLEAAYEVRFVVVDGAQDFCHVSTDLRDEYCDFYLSGCHKWLRAYHPLGLGFYGHHRSRGFIETTLSYLLSEGELDDPLLKMTARRDAEGRDVYAETVNLSPLFSCQGAVTTVHTASQIGPSVLATRLQNLNLVAELATSSGWRPLLTDPGLRSGILLAQSNRREIRRAKPEAIRAEFRDRSVGLTTYENGVIRLSMPETTFSGRELDVLENALRLAP